MRIAISIACLAVTLQLAAQSSAPVLGPLLDGATTLSGTAPQGSAPITIYDVWYPEKTRIGIADVVAADGVFTANLRPALIKGHQIVAMDRNGNASVSITVSGAN